MAKDAKFWENIRPIYLIKEDKKEIKANFEKKPGWLREGIHNHKTLDKAAEMVIEYSKYFKKEADKYDFEVYKTDGDFKQRINEIIKIIV